MTTSGADFLKNFLQGNDKFAWSSTDFENFPIGHTINDLRNNFSLNLTISETFAIRFLI